MNRFIRKVEKINLKVKKRKDSDSDENDSQNPLRLIISKEERMSEEV
jgi:hypothetical protein